MRLYLMMGITATTVFLSGAAHAGNARAWTYDDDYTNQEEWNNLSKDFAACSEGTQQSPVQIAYTESIALPPLDISYRPATGHARLNNHAVEVTFGGKNLVRLDGTKYHLKTLQIHTPGEHTLRDDFYVAELEFLHEDKDGRQLIVSVLAETGEKNTALQPIIDHLPSKAGEDIEVKIDIAALLPKKRTYYAYTGSLTIPPCTEGVEWRIFKSPISISHEQLAALGKLIGRNARLPQPVYMRTIRESAE